MNRRHVLLTEMGLGPVWVSRQRGRATAVNGESAAGVEVDVDVAVAVAVAEGRAPGMEAPRAADASRIDRGPVARAPAAVPPAAVSGAGERRAHILRLDWPELKAAVAGCQACSLSKTRTNTVFGVGDEHAEWMLVGEAPGSEEDARGEPFVGQAGQLLDNMLAALGMDRNKHVYIANVLKCRPPGNRNPAPGEVAQCSPHLERQVALVQPRLVLAMGRFAAQTLLGTEASIASLRGRVHAYQGVPVIVTYHPAYLLRNLTDKAKAWEDLVFARATLEGLKGSPSGK